jgi:hypothetical protein
MVRNPMNFRQVSKVKITPDVVDAVVLWTKNPLPVLDRLDELDGHTYYFQFTVTPYDKDIEPGLPPKGRILDAFRKLSDMIGKDRVIWRYDPILINGKYTPEYHVRAFGDMADVLCDHTRRVTISFIDDGYRCVRSNIGKLALSKLSEDMKAYVASRLAGIAHDRGLDIGICAEKNDMRDIGIGRAQCVDEHLISELTGRRLIATGDNNQRAECRCASSIDIGMYNTCRNGCLYCYANYDQRTVILNSAEHDSLSPLISGCVGDDDIIIERRVRSYRDAQMRLDDL